MFDLNYLITEIDQYPLNTNSEIQEKVSVPWFREEAFTPKTLPLHGHHVHACRVHPLNEL